MLVAIAEIYVRIADREEVRRLMDATQARVRAQRGCVYYGFAEALGDPGHFVLVQEWSDQGALDEHYRSDVFAEYGASVGEHLVRASELRIYEVGAALSPVASGPVEPTQED